MSRLSLTRLKIYRTVARQLHGVVPCWICRQHVALDEATLEHIQPLVDGGTSHLANLAISHRACNNGRHAKAGTAPAG
jgi:5-methylcytosine-specific restriction endonuclease McrA